jgi:maleylpyruvate isomerase
MTAFDDDPLLTLMTEQTDLLLQDVGTLRPDEVRAASLLPGWTRGHVLTHLARNADALGNLVTTALTGVQTPMYRSQESRNQDIEDGSVRTLTDIEADVESASERFLALLADVPVDHLDDLVPSGRGWDVRIRDLPWMRVREVVFHHVDLGIGFTFAQAPDELLDRAVQDCGGERMAGASHRASVTGTLSDGSVTRIVVGEDSRSADAVTVSGPAGAVLAWLTGRGDGSDLDHDGPLPDLPPWG